jgi:hypothetical protein
MSKQYESNVRATRHGATGVRPCMNDIKLAAGCADCGFD